MITYETEVLAPEPPPLTGPNGNWIGVFYKIILTAPDFPPPNTSPDEPRQLVHQAHKHTPAVPIWVSRPRPIHVRDPHHVGNWVEAILIDVDATMPAEPCHEHQVELALNAYLTPAIRAAFTPNPPPTPREHV